MLSPVRPARVPSNAWSRRCLRGPRRPAVALTIGFIGLGIMGSRMAANLQARGYNLIVYNRTRDKAEALLRGGATWGKTPAGVAAGADVLFTMLANPEAVEAAALGKEGFLH